MNINKELLQKIAAYTTISLFLMFIAYSFIGSFYIDSEPKFKDTGDIEDMTDEEKESFIDWKEENNK